MPPRPPARRPAAPPAARTTPGPADRCALLADYASGVVEVQRAMQRLQAGGMPCVVGGAVSLTSAVVGGGGALDVGSDPASYTHLTLPTNLPSDI